MSDERKPPPPVDLLRIKEARLQRELDSLRAQNHAQRIELLDNMKRVAETVWPDLGPLEVSAGLITAGSRILLVVDPIGAANGDPRITAAMIAALAALQTEPR